jgi:hypothetical protein
MMLKPVQALLAVTLGGGLVAGCASPLSRGIPAYPSASKLEADASECEQSATDRAEFARRADYMACMISRGYRTYVSAATYWHLAELTVVAKRGQPRSQVLIDLQGCATEGGAVAGARPLEVADAVEWVGVRVLGREEQLHDRTLVDLIAGCLTRRGYATQVVKQATD